MIPKFRAWDKVTETMQEVLAIDFQLDCAEITQDTVGWIEIDLSNIILMQSTELKDKNGVEIFEHSELDGAYEVIFKDLRYSLRHIHNNDIIDLYHYWRGKNGEIEVTREYTKV